MVAQKFKIPADAIAAAAVNRECSDADKLRYSGEGLRKEKEDESFIIDRSYRLKGPPADA